MNKRFISGCIALLLYSSATFAQSKITGKVISAEDGQPIVGASVIIKGTKTGTVTNLDGTFTINAKDAKTLRISYLGMEPAEVAVAPDMQIVLKPNAKALNEVVVTAMGLTRDKKSLGYAIQEVGGDELTKTGHVNVTSALEGKVAGVQINQFGGGVGASSRISIRGNSSLAADQQPLIVVDGVPIANDTQRTGDNAYTGVDYGSGLNDINPDDIESITVLKGGSAALYGMRAGNGVILITTKSGRKSKGVSVSYDGSLTIDRVSTLPKLQNSYGQGLLGDEYHYSQADKSLYKSYQDYAQNVSFNYVDGKGGGVNDGVDESWGPRLDAGLNLVQYDSNGKAAPWISHPDNVKDFFQTGITMNHTVSIQARSEKASTRASLSYRNQSGTVPNTDQTRYSAQFNTLMKLNKYVSYDLTASYTRTKSDNLLAQGYSGSNPINGLTTWTARQIDMATLKANWAQKDATGAYTYYNWNSNYHTNPYFDVYENTNSYQRDRIFGKTSLYVQPFEWLKLEGRAGVDYYALQTFERHYMDYSDFPDGGFSQVNQKNTELNLDFIATINKDFGDFNLSAMLGANYRDVVWESSTMGASQLTVRGVYTIANKMGDAVTKMDHSHVRSNSVYANASLGWRSQLYLDLSARNDWSSTIKDPFFYPSASLSWIPTEAFSWLKGDGSVLSFMKLRAGWAQIGNATGAYRNRAYYYTEDNAFNGVAQMYKSMTYPNEGLKPENIKTWEIGAELGFLHDRLHLDIAYYHKVTSDQIMYVTTPYSVGFSSMLVNAGKIDNKGVELQVRGDILESSNGLNWSSTLNFSKDKSKIVSLYPGLDTYQIGWTWGVATQAVVGKQWGTLVGQGFDRITEDDVKAGTADASQIGAVKVNEKGLAQSKSAMDFGNVTPKFLMSWRNDFSIKNLSFGLMLDLRIGGDIWSQSMYHSYTTGVAAITAENGVREHAIVAGKDVMPEERFVMQDESGKWVTNTIETDAQTWYESGGVAEMYKFKGSFLKLREAYITYNIPSAWLRKTKFINKASISLVGNNLALLWVDKSNTLRLDPETGGVSSDSRGVGFEQASIPSSRSFGFKLNLTF